MDLTLRKLRARQVEAIKESMQDEIKTGSVELYGKRVINCVTFKDIDDPVRFIGDKALQFSDHSYVLHGLAKTAGRQLKRTASAVG